MKLNRAQLSLLTLGAFVLLGILFLLFSGHSFQSGSTDNLILSGDREAALREAGNIKNFSNTQVQKEIIAAVVSAQDLEKCESAKGVTIDGTDYYQVCRNNVLRGKALAEGNVSYCAELVNATDQKMCEEVTIQAVAKKQGDVAFCDSVSNEEQAFCVGQFARMTAARTANQSACDQIQDQSDRAGCKNLALVAGLMSGKGGGDCSQFPNEIRRGCKQFQTLKTQGRGAVVPCSALTDDPLFSSLCNIAKLANE